MTKYKNLLLSSLILISTNALAEQDLVGIQKFSSEDFSRMGQLQINNEHANYLITINHNAGFTGYYKLEYTAKNYLGVWERFFYRTKKMYVGNSKVFTIPSTATNAILSGFYYTGLIWNPENALFSERLEFHGTPGMGIIRNIDVDVWGTVFSPQYAFTVDQ